MRKKFKLALWALIFFISFSPISLSSLLDFSQASDSEEITTDQEWTTDRVIDNNVTIAPGATLTIRKGVVLTFNNGSILINGSMVVSGTSKNPVIFKKAEDTWFYSITVASGGNLVMRNADVSGSGASIYMIQAEPLVKTANAYFQGGIHVDGGTLNAQGCNFHDNEVAIFVGSDSVDKVVVNRSKFSNNSQMDVSYMRESEEYALDFRYNWWGSVNGPQKNCYTYGGEEYCYFERMEGAIDFSNWLKAENFHDPVVIVPGVFGSQKQDDVWKIDPIFHVYDNLIDEFKNNGYEIGKDLFVFPYDWHQSNIENAIRLRYRIEEIKTVANWPKVDVVAHSMGGLMAREYIQSNAYQEDIDQLITLGTPNNGSPEIYPLFEAGKAIGAVQTGMKRFLEQEMEEAGYANMFKYIHGRPIYSASELLPDYEYLFDDDMNQPLIYPQDYPVNDFLDNLNNQFKIKKLENVEYTKIVGNAGSGEGTISGFNIIKVDMGEIWEHGYPLGFEIIAIGDKGAMRGPGDGTVPLSSAKSIAIPSDNYLELESAHTNLPTDAQEDILEALTGVRPSTVVKESLIKNMLQVFVHSPVDIQIISPSGVKYGKDFENDTIFENEDGSFYSGFETENEFLTIPNPEDGEYRIITKGTGEGGEYRIEAVKISQDQNDEAKSIESVKTMAGVSVPGEIEEKTIEIVGEKIVGEDVTGQVKDEIAPEAKISFNPETEKIDIVGIDNVPGNVSVSLSQQIDKRQKITQTAILTDSAGNNTTLVLEKKKDKDHRIEISLVSIAYNGEIQEVSNASLTYKWHFDQKKEAYAMFASKIGVSDETLESHFRPKENITILMQKPQDLDSSIQDGADSRPIKEEIPGMTIFGLETEKGQVKISRQ